MHHTSLRKRSFDVRGVRTSVALEPEFWAVLLEIAKGQKLSLAQLIGRVREQRQDVALASALRSFALGQRRQVAACGAAATPDGSP